VDLSSPAEIAIVALIGLVGGLFGGVLGLGGSLLIIPALTFAFGPNQHLYQAAALVVNVVVAAAATLRHRGRGTINGEVVPAMAVLAAVAAIAGVFASNLLDARRLMALFGIFLLACAATEIMGALRRNGQEAADAQPRRLSARRAGGVGVLGGLASGLLGIGGGAIMVPLLRGWVGLPMRSAVASSAAVMILACVVGAVAKNASIASLASPSGEPLTLSGSLVLAALLAPTATAGATLGAALVYRLPVRAIRFTLSALLVLAGARMVLGGFAG